MGLVDLVFPKKCVGCGRLGEYVCQGCEVGMWEPEQVCPECGKLSMFGLTHVGCKTQFSADGLSCLWTSEGLVGKIIHKARTNNYFDYLIDITRKSSHLFDREEYSKFKQWTASYKPYLCCVKVSPSHDPTGMALMAKEFSKTLKIPLFKSAQPMPKFVILVSDMWNVDTRRQARILKEKGVAKAWILALAK